jgi:2-polyprenyl-3-methyl-5-hydroxy-6-metoxy-1,4-benzoquinol methylase
MIFKSKPRGAREVAPVQVHKSQLITDEHCILNKAMHAAPRGFGQSGQKHAPLILRFVEELHITSILDYGCGQGTFSDVFRGYGGNAKVSIKEYDPAIEGKDKLPEPADLVLCTDVLEHVEPQCIEAVLNHLASLTQRYGYFVISLVPANKFMPDGRNAHVLIRDRKWWHAECKKRWHVMSWEQRNDSITLQPKEVAIWVTNKYLRGK